MKSKTDIILQLSRIAERKLERDHSTSADALQERSKALVSSFLSSSLSPDYIRELSLDYDGMSLHSISHSDRKIENAARAGIALISETVKNRKIETLKQDHDALEYLAGHDLLTSLPNRRTLTTEMRTQIDGTEDAVFMIFDLRNFKYINDTFDHTMGDNALKLFADVSREFCSEYGGIIARTGGDEFIGMFKDYSLEEGKEMAQAFRILLQSKFRTQEMLEKDEVKSIHDIPFTAAIGITSLYNTDGGSIQIEHKDKQNTRTEIENRISRALKKADLMAHAAKDAEHGIVADWDDAYLETAKLNPRYKELRNQFEQILRHWISDENIPENIKKIRALLLPSLSFHETIEEIDALWGHINRLLQESDIDISEQVSRDLQTELEGLKKRWSEEQM